MVQQEVGLEFRRNVRDIVVIGPRRASNQAWSAFNVPSYSYRFNVTVSGVAPIAGATRFQEVAFVFNNTRGEWYTVNPFGNLSVSDVAKFDNLAIQMSRSWVSFVTELDPNEDGIPDADVWPIYNSTTSGGEGMNMVFTVNGSSYAEHDTFRGEGIAFVSENALSVYGR